MKYRGFGLLECKVLCENRALADLGVRSDIWMPFTLDLAMVQAIKVSVDDDQDDPVGYAFAQVLFKGAHECMVIDVRYHEMRRIWLAFKAGTLSVEDDPRELPAGISRAGGEGTRNESKR